MFKRICKNERKKMEKGDCGGRLSQISPQQLSSSLGFPPSLSPSLLPSIEVILLVYRHLNTTK